MLQILLIYLWILYVKKHVVIYEYPVKLGVFEWKYRNSSSKGLQWWLDLLSQWNKKSRERAFPRYLIQQFKYVIRTWVYLSFHRAVLHVLSSAWLLSWALYGYHIWGTTCRHNSLQRKRRITSVFSSSILKQRSPMQTTQ